MPGHQPLTPEHRGKNTNQFYLLWKLMKWQRKANENSFKRDDFLSVQTAGENDVSHLKSLPVQLHLFNSDHSVKPTLVLPQNKCGNPCSKRNYLFIQVTLQNKLVVTESSKCLYLCKRNMYLYSSNESKEPLEYTLEQGRRFNEKQNTSTERTSELQPRTLV